ncbi:class I SAM-dependent methyltransferase [Palaeococcus ferrophilus]|uniref:class I SAM-dependent methyltransferase n=1 Tax=Palaeococcus ferrophilus TaxID=83868 RepID=UPI00064EB658|nr:class I SAM-dependent methyltransferase [Palaeococcus ferrophilus]
MEGNKLIRVVDANIEHMVNMSLLYIVQLGTKHDVFKLVSERPSYPELLARMGAQNKALLKKFLDKLIKLKIVEETPIDLTLNGFSYEIRVPSEDYKLLLSDWMPEFEEIYRMVDFALITPEHPHVLMDFDKDADFWDMRMRTAFASAYRKLIVALGEIKNGTEVLDIGCGSVSPVEIGRYASPDGYYLGIDYSPALLEIARSRVESLNLENVKLKEIDAHIIKPHNSYDVAIMSFVLEYLKNPRTVLKRTLESLGSGGRLIVVEPFRDQFANISALEFFEGLNKDFVEFPSREEVKSFVLEEGFDVNFEDVGKSTLVIKKL